MDVVIDLLVVFFVFWYGFEFVVGFWRFVLLCYFGVDFVGSLIGMILFIVGVLILFWVSGVFGLFVIFVVVLVIGFVIVVFMLCWVWVIGY